MKNHSIGRLAGGSACAALAVALALTANADYQFIRTAGWDAETASQAKSSTLASDGTDLEARYRTWLESDGTDLVTTEFVGTFIFIR